MNPENATALYVSACRSVLQCDPRQHQTFSEMYKLLPFFRQSLSCLVCGSLVQDPIAPTNSSCQHYVCRACKGQKMLLKPSCSWCKDYSCFQENRQLSLLVHCYRQLCLYITHSPLLKQINSQVGGSPELMTLLEEVLVSKEEEKEETEELSPDMEELKPSPALTPIAPPPTENPPERSHPTSSSLNWPQGCNGAGLEDLEPSSPELEVCETVEEMLLQAPGLLSEPGSGSRAGCKDRDSGPGCGGLEVTPGPLVPTRVCSFGEGRSARVEDGEVLLLSVEEVLQTLDPVSPTTDSLVQSPTYTHAHPDRTHTPLHAQSDRSHAHTHHPSNRTCAPPRPAPTTAPQPPLVRPNRKRSRSESDRERVQPLPISSILQGPPPQTPTQPTPSQSLPTHTYSALSNGGAPPKPARPPLTSSKAGRKHPEQGPKRPHAKARAGGPKAKDRSRDHRLLSGCLLPPIPAKPLYKKPAEKKGCKCGRATQNPSVLTCRGQRCPCYSNRKACLDCICRGCQNSYMANGEKKLEAFAVPEKALEQTRLTLGINLTSIAAAAALRSPPANSVHGNSLLNVTTATGTPVAAAFLSPSPPRDPAYQDALDLGFHC
ncbi:E3 ubiquitin-protein ligase MSL2a [Osmerus mordax]|uniref:E3 ubiquitin-protein ligase MSL2a n=1 Tax=Osmerus mordax TaxID=8014 RepID=UPI00350F05BA